MQITFWLLDTWCGGERQSMPIWVMPKFCANLGFLFMEHAFLDRFAAAAKGGFKGVESPIPYDFPVELQADLLREHGLQQVLINMPAGNWAGGERGIGCLPDRVNEFQAGVGHAIETAKAFNCSLVNCLAGIKPDAVPHDKAWETLVSNLRFAGIEVQKAGMTLLVEPINRFDIPGFFLNTSAQAMRAIDETGDTHTKLQYDIYHMQRMEGELSGTIERLFPRIGHFQCAGVPGRTEPDRGEINYDVVFGLIDKLGYDGWIGAEYRSVAGTEQGLSWLKRYQT
jgi:hydroxypyruvate isomerase